MLDKKYQVKQFSNVLMHKEEFVLVVLKQLNEFNVIQARKAQLLSFQLGTREVQGSNSGKGDNFSMNISK